MELGWSEQSPHIRTLFRPWQPGDGYDEATLAAAEARLGVRLPTMLRTFYRAWGRRRDLTQLEHHMVSPDVLELRADALIVWVENQAVWSWGIQRSVLAEADPPVVITERGWWEVESEQDWKASHAHLSSFLDDMTYQHAFAGGAIHGGWAGPGLHDLPTDQIAWLEAHWGKATVSPWAFGMAPDTPSGGWPPLYIRDGQALFPPDWCKLAARETEVVDEIAQRFQITWAHRW